MLKQKAMELLIELRNPYAVAFHSVTWSGWFGGIYALNYLGINVWVAWIITSLFFYGPYIYRYRSKLKDIVFNVRFWLTMKARW